MKVSILVPIYGVEKFIERCAISLFEQTYENIEYIFVDDCTPDKSMSILRDVIETYPNRKPQVKIIKHKKNQGLAAARLSGLLASTGEFIWFVDSDDWVEKDAIDRALHYMQEGYDLIISDYYREGINNCCVYNNPSFSTDKVLINKISPSIWKCIVKRSLFIENNIFPVIGINHSEDFLLTGRLSLVALKPVVLKNVCLYHYNCSNEDSYMNNISIRSLENAAECATIVFDFYYEHKALKKHRTALSFMLGKRYLNLKEKDPNNKYLKDITVRAKYTILPVYVCINYFFYFKKLFGVILKVVRANILYR